MVKRSPMKQGQSFVQFERQNTRNKNGQYRQSDYSCEVCQKGLNSQNIETDGRIDEVDQPYPLCEKCLAKAQKMTLAESYKFVTGGTLPDNGRAN